jgi:precorrin-8X/cobalt-precorrin-8 methylmutase
MSLPIHPIMEQSFAVIDREIGEHHFTPAEYAIVRRVIHSTVDFLRGKDSFILLKRFEL